MSDETAKTWFIRKFTRDLFFVTAVTWFILFVMEIVKEGIVSNYISLPHIAVLLLVFGVIAVAYQKPVDVSIQNKLSKIQIIVLAVLSVILALVLSLVIQASVALTILIVVVTILALWAGTLILRDGE